MNDVAIIMCTWKRPERLSRTMDLLLNQTNKNFKLFIWNNNLDIQDVVNLNFGIYGKKMEMEVFHSEKNVGGFGRFFMAQKIMDEYEKIIFIDDDQIFSNNMVDRFLEVFDENAVKSRWSFRLYGTNYIHRTHVDDGNVNVHYCGTGGMIVPSKVFRCEELYEIPNEFLFIEDLWLCFIASHYLDMKLVSIRNDFVTQEVDGKDQTTVAFYSVKTKFLKYLINERKWKILES